MTLSSLLCDEIAGQVSELRLPGVSGQAVRGAVLVDTS